MKLKVFYLLSIAGLLLFSVGCSDKKTQKPEENEAPFVFEFTNQDSISISNLVDEYVAAFNSRDLERCADFIFKVRNDSVFPLTTDERRDFIASMSNISAFGCERTDLSLKTDRDNKAYIAIFLAEADSLNPQAERPAARFILNPVKVDDTWHLTVFDPRAEGVGIY